MALPQLLDYGKDFDFLVTNTLAYLASSSERKKKVYESDKLERLSLASPSSSV